MDRIPAPFAQRMAELYGEAGREWLDNLPSLIGNLAQRWSLDILAPFEPLSYNYVAPAMCADGTEVVLKVGVINRELLTEIEALRLYDGRGSVQLLETDPQQGAFLLERLKPGTQLATLVEADDEQATSIAVGIMRQLWRPLPPEHPFPTVTRWTAGLGRLRQRFGGGTGPFPRHLVEMAESLFAELIPSMEETVLLHADLHHFNILAAEREPWLALDPKGVAGEPAYEVGALLRNPWPAIVSMPHVDRILARRADQLIETLGFDRKRILGWGVAQAVLSAWWSYEDHGHGWEPALAYAEILARISTQR
jgi:streptomycin 6-kinase